MLYLTLHSTHSMEGRKEMFYLMMHSTHFIYGHIASTHFTVSDID